MLRGIFFVLAPKTYKNLAISDCCASRAAAAPQRRAMTSLAPRYALSNSLVLLPSRAAVYALAYTKRAKIGLKVRVLREKVRVFRICGITYA